MKSAIALSLVLVSVQAFAAGWVRVAEGPQGVTYVDAETIRIDGDRRRAWQLADLREATKLGDRSYKQLNEFDCKELRIRPLQLTWFTGQMGAGSVSASGSQNGEWAYAVPASMGSDILKAVCESGALR